jgi:hypothetical protein
MDKLRRASLLLFASGIAIALGCTQGLDGDSTRDQSDTTHDRKATEETQPEFHAQLLEIAANYQALGRFDELLRFGPPPCSAPLDGEEQTPRKPEPSRVRFSKSNDADTHGKKLYYLYVKDQKSYGYVSKKQDVGQVVVKEAWTPVLANDARGATVALDPDDKKHYRAGEKLGLFIMAKLDPETPNTDEGWVYGTVSADGKRVTSAGRVESCMACHQGDKTTDRMFGVDVLEPGEVAK